MVEVVDPDEPDRVVEYGETGRVRLTTLTKEFFMPRFLERDEAEREPPCDMYPWDGVRNVRPFSRFQTASLKECIDCRLRVTGWTWSVPLMRYRSVVFRSMATIAATRLPHSKVVRA